MSAGATDIPRQPRVGSLAEKVLLAESLQLPPVAVAAFLHVEVEQVHIARRRLRRMGHVMRRRWPDAKQRAGA